MKRKQKSLLLSLHDSPSQIAFYIKRLFLYFSCKFKIYSSLIFGFSVAEKSNVDSNSPPTICNIFLLYCFRLLVCFSFLYVLHFSYKVFVCGSIYLYSVDTYKSLLFIRLYVFLKH